MTIHFQRIKFLVTQSLALLLLATENPPLGFDVQTPQLVAHALDGGFHFSQRDLNISDLLLDSPAKDRGFARQIDQAFQLFRRDLDHFRCRALGIGVACGRWRRGLGQPKRRDMSHSVRHSLWQVIGVAETMDTVDQQPCTGQRLVSANRVEHVCQQIMAAEQQTDQQRITVQGPGREALVEIFQFVREVADGGDFHHARPALERVQVAQQVFHFQGVLRFILPTRQGTASAFENIEAFFEENLQQFRVALGQCRDLRFSRFRVHLRGRQLTAALAELANRFDQIIRATQRLMALQLL